MSRGVVINVKEVAKRSLLRWHDFSSRAQGCIGMLPEKNNSFWHSIGKAPEVPCFTKMGPSRITWSTFPVLVATDPSKSGEPPVFYPLFCFFAWKVNSLNRITSRCTKLLRKGPASTSIQPHLPSCSSIVNNQKKMTSTLLPSTLIVSHDSPRRLSKSWLKGEVLAWLLVLWPWFQLVQ